MSVNDAIQNILSNDRLLNTGLSAFHRGDLRSALASFVSRSIAIPDDHNDFYLIGLCHFLLGNFLLASQYLKKMTLLDRSHLAARNLGHQVRRILDRKSDELLKLIKPPLMNSEGDSVRVALIMGPVWNVEHPPLSTAYIAGILKAAGYRVHSYDFSNQFILSLNDECRREFHSTYLPPQWYSDFPRYRATLRLDDLVDQWARRSYCRNQI